MKGKCANSSSDSVWCPTVRGAKMSTYLLSIAVSGEVVVRIAQLSPEVVCAIDTLLPGLRLGKAFLKAA